MLLMRYLCALLHVFIADLTSVCILGGVLHVRQTTTLDIDVLV